MPAPEKFYAQLGERLLAEKDRKIQDKLLDLWLATSQMATEWDARQWGFDPDKWEFELRDLIAKNDKKQVVSRVRPSRPE